jgi:hypothetical protein
VTVKQLKFSITLVLFILVVMTPGALGAGQGNGVRGQSGSSGAAAPTSTAAPSISGSAVVGQSLTASTGSWSGSVSSYAYQWLLCDSAGNGCTSAAGATGSAYALTSSAVGYTFRVDVTASNKYGASMATSNPTGVVAPAPAPAPVSAPTNSAPPTISGSAVVSQMLSASAGTWSGSPTSYGYQWRHCDSAGAACVNVSGATSASYTLSSGDVGFTLRVAVTASNSGGSATAVSAQTTLVAAASTSTAYPASFFTGPLGAKNVLPPKASGALLGASSQGSFDQQKQQVLSRESYFARKYDMVQIHYGAPSGGCDYGQGYSPFTSGMEQWIDQHGSIIVMSWTHGWTLDQVNQGYADTCLINFGKKAAAFGKPVLLRIYWEFNGGTLRWAGSGQPFIDAWRRTVSKIREGGGTNVGFIWNPDGGYRATAFASYPGDAYVDWVGTSVYNFNNPNAWCGYHAGWCEFWESLSFDPVKYPAVYDVYAKTKPFIVPEMGSKEDPYTVGRKGQWMLNARDSLKTKFPGVRAINYFDIDASTTEGGGRNWRLDTSQSSLDGFRSLAQDAYFKTR